LDTGAAIIDRHPETRFIIDHLALLWHFKSMPGRLSRRYADRNRFYAAA
jgi:hypothetical protein